MDLTIYTMWALFLWLMTGILLSVGFVSLIFIRITTPRFKFETLSRFGWLTGLSLILAIWATYAIGFIAGVRWVNIIKFPILRIN